MSGKFHFPGGGSGGGGGGGGDVTLISKVVTSGLQTLIHFDVPPTFTHLRLIGAFALDNSAIVNPQAVFMTVNGDASHLSYSTRYLQLNNLNNAEGGTDVSSPGMAIASMAQTNNLSTSDVLLLDYNATVGYKQFQSEWSGLLNSAIYLGIQRCQWQAASNTPAITSIDLTPAASGPFANGHAVSLYGFK